MDAQHLTSVIRAQVALRFRDITHTDTILAHHEVLKNEGAVWWGWWKKDTENEHRDCLERLRTNSDKEIFLVDRARKRLFLARYLQICTNQNGVDERRIPAYALESRELVAAWFLLTSIEPIDYSEDLDRLFAVTDGATFIELSNSSSAKPNAQSNRYSTRGNTILHLSDLHFGADFQFLPQGSRAVVGEHRLTLTEAILKDLARTEMGNDIGIVLITGDFTTRGDWSDKVRSEILQEFERLRRALNIEPEQIVAVPGNHDMDRYPQQAGIDPEQLAVACQTTYKHEREFRNFLEELTGRHWKNPLNRLHEFQLPNIALDIVALNSCSFTSTKWTEYGYVGTQGLDLLDSLQQRGGLVPTCRIMALHHHLIPVNREEWLNADGVSLTLDAVKILKAASRSGIQIALHGHQHIPAIAKYESFSRKGEEKLRPIFVISGGSAGVISSRRNGDDRNSYSLLKIEPSKVNVVVRELRFDGEQGGELYKEELPIHQ